jgi:hypothetical protein
VGWKPVGSGHKIVAMAPSRVVLFATFCSLVMCCAGAVQLLAATGSL